MKSEIKTVMRLYTDGSSRGNPGLGGWAVIVMGHDTVVELAGAKNPATNNQMELEAVIRGLVYVQEHTPEAFVEIHADSRYVLNGIEKWLDGWVKKGWMTMAKKPVENRTQWESLLELRDHFNNASNKKLKLVKVDGHSGHRYNDRCDELAVAAALSKQTERKSLFNGHKDDYEQFLKENPPRSIKKSEKKSSSKSKTGLTYAYVSLVDGKIYSDQDWATCEKRVKGKSAKYKKVYSKAEEIELIKDYRVLLDSSNR